LRSHGFAFDRANSDTLWQPSKEQNVTVSELTSIPYIADYWQKNPWGLESIIFSIPFKTSYVLF